MRPTSIVKNERKKMLGVKVIKRVEIWILNLLPVDGIHDTHFDT